MRCTRFISPLLAASLMVANLACACAHVDEESVHESSTSHHAHASHHDQAVAPDTSYDCHDLLCEHSFTLCADCTTGTTGSLTSIPQAPNVDADADEDQDQARALDNWALERPFRRVEVRSLGHIAPVTFAAGTSVSFGDQLIE